MKKSALFTLVIWRGSRSLPPVIHPLQMLVETSLVDMYICDAHLKLTDESLRESLHNLDHQTLEAFPRCFQGPPEVMLLPGPARSRLLEAHLEKWTESIGRRSAPTSTRPNHYWKRESSSLLSAEALQVECVHSSAEALVQQ